MPSAQNVEKPGRINPVVYITGDQHEDASQDAGTRWSLGVTTAEPLTAYLATMKVGA